MLDLEELDRLHRIATEPSELLRRQEARDELWQEFVAAATHALPSLIARIRELEAKLAEEE